MTSAANALGTVSMTYDDLDRLTSTTDVWGVTLSYTINLADEVTQVTDSLGGVTDSVYDNAGRLTSRT